MPERAGRVCVLQWTMANALKRCFASAEVKAKVPREDMSILIRALSKTLSTDLSIFITDLFFRLSFYYRGGRSGKRSGGLSAV